MVNQFFSVSSSLFFNFAINMLFFFFVVFNLSNTFSLCLSLSICKHLLAMPNDIFLNFTLRFHIRLELMCQLFDLTLVHLVNILEFHYFLKFILLLVKWVEHSTKNIVSALNLSISKFSVDMARVVVCTSCIFVCVVSTHIVFVFLISLFSFLSFNQFIVNVFKLFKAGYRVFLILSCALF